MLVQSIYYALVGMIIFAIGSSELFVVALFYLGRRRDLYFKTGRDWHSRAREGLGLFLAGAGMSAGFIFSRFTFLLVVPFCLVPLWFMMTVQWVRIPPPAWVNRFEADRTSLEIDYIKLRGTLLLKRYPKIFPMMINSQDGWEAWIMTVIEMETKNAS